MAKGVYTRVNRVSFVKGWLTGGTDPADGSVECGYGTVYPTIATLDQVAELYYRCRNTKIDGYEVVSTSDDSPSTQDRTLFNGAAEPPAQNYKSADRYTESYQQFNQRGWAFRGSNAEWLAAHCGPAYPAEFDELGFPTDTTFHDGEDELCMWAPDGIVERVYTGNGAAHVSGHFGFNQSSPPSTYGAYRRSVLVYSIEDELVTEISYSGANIQFLIEPEVVFVGGDTPFSAGVTLYPRIEFLDASTFYRHGSINSSRPFGGLAEVVLSSGTLQLPVYMQPRYGWTTQLVTPPKLIVTEWWPYAKGSPAVPVWNSATGAKL